MFRKNGKVCHDATHNLYVQMNSGFQYDLQSVSDSIMHDRALEGLLDFDSAFLCDNDGNLLASWIASGVP